MMLCLYYTSILFALIYAGSVNGVQQSTSCPKTSITPFGPVHGKVEEEEDCTAKASRKEISNNEVVCAELHSYPVNSNDKQITKYACVWLNSDWFESSDTSKCCMINDLIMLAIYSPMLSTNSQFCNDQEYLPDLCPSHLIEKAQGFLGGYPREELLRNYLTHSPPQSKTSEAKTTTVSGTDNEENTKSAKSSESSPTTPNPTKTDATQDPKSKNASEPNSGKGNGSKKDESEEKFLTPGWLAVWICLIVVVFVFCLIMIILLYRLVQRRKRAKKVNTRELNKESSEISASVATVKTGKSKPKTNPDMSAPILPERDAEISVPIASNEPVPTAQPQPQPQYVSLGGQKTKKMRSASAEKMEAMQLPNVSADRNGETVKLHLDGY